MRSTVYVALPVPEQLPYSDYATGYVDYQTLAHLSYSSCVYWISARATRAKRFLSVRESISASRILLQQVCESTFAAS